MDERPPSRARRDGRSRLNLRAVEQRFDLAYEALECLGIEWGRHADVDVAEPELEVGREVLGVCWPQMTAPAFTSA